MKKLVVLVLTLAVVINGILVFTICESEKAETEIFNTASIEKQFEYGFEEGACRIELSWARPDGLLETYSGSVWEVTEEFPIGTQVLLWIADNHTPEDITDDVIVWMWKEIKE